MDGNLTIDQTFCNEEGDILWNIPEYNENGQRQHSITVIPANFNGKMLLIRSSVPAQDGKPNFWRFPSWSCMESKNMNLNWEHEVGSCLCYHTGLKPSQVVRHHYFFEIAFLSEVYISYIEDLETKIPRNKKDGPVEFRFVSVREWSEMVNAGECDITSHPFHTMRMHHLAVAIGDTDLYPTPVLNVPDKSTQVCPGEVEV